jgi:hypothetical protein
LPVAYAPDRSPGLALAGLHAGVFLVDDIDPSAATYHAAVLVADFGRFEAVTDAHGTGLAKLWLRVKTSRAR